MFSSKNVIMEEKLCVRGKKLTQRKKLKKICKKGRKKSAINWPFNLHSLPQVHMLLAFFWCSHFIDTGRAPEELQLCFPSNGDTPNPKKPPVLNCCKKEAVQISSTELRCQESKLVVNSLNRIKSPNFSFKKASLKKAQCALHNDNLYFVRTHGGKDKSNIIGQDYIVSMALEL